MKSIFHKNHIKTIGLIIIWLCIVVSLAFTAPLQKARLFPLKDAPAIISLKDAKILKVSVNTVTFKKAITPLVIENPITSGLSWLEQNQKPDGSWGESAKTKIRDTERVLEALHWLGQQESAPFFNGVNWCRLYIPNNNDFRARQIHALSLFSEDTTDSNNFLIQQINPNGGFGYQVGYGSDILTSALVLRALTASGYEDPGENPNATVIAIL